MTQQLSQIEQIEQIKNEASKYYSFEQAVKLMLNSIYGAFGSSYFYFFNVAIAETITLQGQDAILFTEKMINKYFTDFWHKDKELHEKLGVTVKSKAKKPATVYIDTDSCYISFEEMIGTTDYTGSSKEFILKIYEYRLKEFISTILEKYANHYNANNFLNFELESIAKNAIWLAKKNYIQNIVWKDPDLHYDELTKISTKGFDIIKPSTSSFARKTLKELVTYIFSKKNFDIREFSLLLKEYKRSFKLANIDNISVTKNINNYQSYVLNDTTDFEIANKCPAGVRAAGYYNYLLYNSNVRSKYKPVTSGEKLKMYYSVDKVCDMFAYSPGDFPYEFAPKIDYDTQFEKTILDPINRVIKALGYKQFDRNIIYTQSIF